MHSLRTDTQQIRVIDGDLAATREIPAPWMRPRVTATYRRPNRWRRFASSGFARDVQSGVRRRLLPVLGLLGAAWLFLLFLRGAAVLAALLGVAP